MAWSRLQSCISPDTGGAGTAAATFTTANLTAGTTLIAAVTIPSSAGALGTCSGVTDGTNSFIKIGEGSQGGAGGGCDLSVWALNTPAGDAGTKPTITATSTDAAATMCVLVEEVSGLATGTTAAQLADGTIAFKAGTAGGATTAPAYSSGAANEYLFYAYADAGFGVANTPPGSPWTADTSNRSASGNSNVAVAYKNSTGGAESGSWTVAAGSWVLGMVAFQLAAGSIPFQVPAPQPGSRNYRRQFRRAQQRLPVPPPSVSANAGAAAVASAATMGRVAPAFLTSVVGTGTSQYFADQYGDPYLLRWDTVWNLIVNAGNSGGSTTYQTDMDGYTSARAGEGFNGFLVTTTANSNIPGAPFNNGNTWDGVAPFSSPGVLNNTFWTRVDYLLNSAKLQGMTVVINACYTYSVFATGSCLNGWTATQFQNYGAAVGARYASQPNLIWEVGDDYGGSWDGGLNGFDTQFAAFLTGLRGAGANQLISVENMSEGASRYSIDLATTYAWGVSHAQFDWVYSYDTAYTAVEDAYTEAANKSVASLPVVKMDGWYDHQWNGATPTETVELFGRKWIWWSLSSGSRGAMYGQNELYQWPVNALSSGLAGPSPGSVYMQPSALNTAWSTFASFPGWHLLVPDTGSALVTAGRGTRSNGAFGTGAGTAGPTSMYLGGNTYVTASRTPDSGSGSSLAVIYIPAATTITIDQTKVVSGYTATWVDPASGAHTVTTTGSTYNSTAQGANSAGDHDWVLVLGPSLATNATAAAGAGGVSVVANAPAVAVTVTAAAAAVAAAAPGAAVAEGALAGAAAVLAVSTLPSVAIIAATVAATAAAGAPAATAAEIVSAGAPAVLAAAPAATAAETVFAGAGVIGAADPGATVSTSGNANAQAGVAAVSVTSAGVTPAAAVPAGAAAALAAVPPATAAVTAIAGTGVIAALAPQPSVITSAGTTANAGVAAVLATATAASNAVTVTAQAAAVPVAALPTVPPFQVARNSGTTVTDPRDGTEAVTAVATSSPGVS